MLEGEQRGEDAGCGVEEDEEAGGGRVAEAGGEDHCCGIWGVCEVRECGN